MHAKLQIFVFTKCQDEEALERKFSGKVPFGSFLKKKTKKKTKKRKKNLIQQGMSHHHHSDKPEVCWLKLHNLLKEDTCLNITLYNKKKLNQVLYKFDANIDSCMACVEINLLKMVYPF